MYRKEKTENIISINFLNEGGGIGDLIARLPAWQFVYNHHPQVNMLIWVQDFAVDLVKRSLPQDKKRIHVRGYSENKKYNDKLLGRSFSAAQFTNLATHMTDHAFLTCVNYQPENKYKNYLKPRIDDVDVSRFNLPDKFVVITTGFTSKVREWKPQSINETVQYIKSRGYDVVFLGSEKADTGYKYTIKGNFKEEIDYSQGLNLINQTNLVEAVKIISNAKTIVGCDNGLLHLAAMTDIPIVGAYTTVDSKHRMPYRNNVLGWNYYSVEISKQELACVGCQSNLQFSYDHSFTECFYGDIKCVELLTSDKFTTQLDKIL